jgi:hypothetical protein
MRNPTWLIVSLVGAWTGGPMAGTGAWAQQPPLSAPTAVEQELVTIPVTVEDIDKANRKLTVKTADGERLPLSVPADVEGLEKLAKGDQIDVDYYQAVAMRVFPSGGAGATRPTSTVAGGKGAQATRSFQVLSVNDRNKTMNVKDTRGQSQTVSVRDPALQTRVRDLKPGDMIDLTYSEAVLAGIHPHRK